MYLYLSVYGPDLIAGGEFTQAGGIPASYIARWNGSSWSRLGYICGNVDGNGTLDLGDVFYLIAYLYKNGPAPVPLQAGDADSSGGIDLGDVLHLISYLYKNGPAPGC